ncbi:MAG: anhydro-N-acetylmuramic acid kinase [Rhodospirillaceae bacterium]|nr:anhydro-N-acetylmuramic acid kinase [Rhodospirillaceae bacterium]
MTTFKPLRVIGLMSGTSMDGVDAAFMETDGEGHVRSGPALTVSYTPEVRARLAAFISAAPERGASPLEAVLERDLTDLHAAAVTDLLRTMNMSSIDLVGFHGQTIWHRPRQGATWQMGDGARLAEALAVPVAFDFRSADVAAGGQGAPLLPVYHAALTPPHVRPIAVLNIGGVANLTWIGAGAADLLGFDTGPGNALMDDWVKARLGLAMDKDGAVAAQGRVHEDLVARLMDHPFFAEPPPKSLDRLAFSAADLAHLSTEDGAATLTAFTAAAAARGLAHCGVKPQRVFVTGGGRRNPTLMKMLGQYSGIAVETVDGNGWDGDALEAQGFAYLAVRALRGLPLTFPGTTGVRAPLTGGRIVTPRPRAAVKSA